MKNLLISSILLVAGLSPCGPLCAQESFYRIYQFETPYKGHLEFTHWTSYVASSNTTYNHYKRSYSRNQLVASSLEAEYGVGDHFVLAGYADFDDPKNGHLSFAQSRLEARYRFGERFDHFVNTAVYLEYYMPAGSYSNSPEVETRLILDKDFGDFRVVVNPTVTKYVKGSEDRNWQPAVSTGIYYRRHKFLQPGIEYYENFHEHTVSFFPTIDLNFSGAVIWNLGVGFGSHEPADKLLVKSILQIDLELLRPSRFMRRSLE